MAAPKRIPQGTPRVPKPREDGTFPRSRRAAESWSRLAAEANPCPCCVTVLQGDRLRIVWANEDFVDHFPTAAVLPTDLDGCVPINSHQADMLAGLITGTGLDSTVLGVGGSETVAPYEVFVSSIHDGVPAAVMTFVAPPAERDGGSAGSGGLDAEAAHQEIDFTARVVHELKTPLNSILGFSELISKETAGPLTVDQCKNYAENIITAGNYMVALVNDLLGYAKAADGSAELSESPCDVTALIDLAVSLTTHTPETDSITISSAAGRDLPYLIADPRRLNQIIFNLLTNAIKFTPIGGTVLINAGVEADDRIFVAVLDTGVGIARKDFDSIMTPFGQVASRQVENDRGTGLGLPITRQMLRMHGGELEIMSTPGQGSTFIARFPAYRTHRQRNTTH